jgi:superfamily II DNA or RNA helicase
MNKMKRDEIQEEALKATEGRRRCSVVLGTGVGKTLVGLLHIERNTNAMQNVLVVAPKKSIFQSWSDDAVKFGKQDILERITFSTYIGLPKRNPDEYDYVYLDECHSLLDSHRTFLDVYKGGILGLTGTPPKHRNSEKGIMVAQYCPVVHTFKADDAIENGIINDYQIIVHELELDKCKNYQVNMKTKSFITSEYDNYRYWGNRLDMGQGPAQMLRVMRMKAMMEYKSKEKYTKKLMESIDSKCIVFANTQEQADKLCRFSYHSGNKDSEDNLLLFKEGKIDKLSCVLQLNEGINIPNLRQGIIMHAYGNERKAAQRIGRLLRLNPDEKAIVHILCYKGTVDEKWVKEALEGFDQEKIVWRNYDLKLN